MLLYVHVSHSLLMSLSVRPACPRPCLIASLDFGSSLCELEMEGCAMICLVNVSERGREGERRRCKGKREVYYFGGTSFDIRAFP